MGLLSKIFGGTGMGDRDVTAAAFAPSGEGFVVVDTETTGLSAQHDRILEIATVVTDPRGHVIHEWVSRINPQGPVGATHIHGISNADVAGAPVFEEVAPTVMSMLRGRAFVAHNAKFDLAFVSAELRRLGWVVPALPTLCTLNASSYYLPQLDRRRLPDCCQAAGIRLTQHHSALADARATAELLQRFLRSDGSPRPRSEDVSLVERARGVQWPDLPNDVPVPRPATSGGRRRPATAAAATASPPLVSLLADYRVADVLDEGVPEGALAYLELLIDVLEDGNLSSDETASLADLAETYELSPVDLERVHRAFIVVLADKAVEDGRVSTSERGEIKAMASLLGLSESVVPDALNRARERAATAASVGLPPLPDAWTHGEPVRVGDRVAFTGCDERERASLEARATSLGVRVTGAVSQKTSMLVTDGEFSGTKAAAAQSLGTRIVHPTLFAVLLDHIQPAVSA